MCLYKQEKHNTDLGHKKREKTGKRSHAFANFSGKKVGRRELCFTQ